MNKILDTGLLAVMLQAAGRLRSRAGTLERVPERCWI